MRKARKMLGTATSAYIVSLKNVMGRRSKRELAIWALEYVEVNILPIFQKYYPTDGRPMSVIVAARGWLVGEVGFGEVKGMILNGCHAAAREADDNPAAQAAARAVGQAASIIHIATHGIGVAFYGAAAVAYDRYGVGESEDFYDRVAASVCADMEKNLCDVAKKRGASIEL